MENKNINDYESNGEISMAHDNQDDYDMSCDQTKWERNMMPEKMGEEMRRERRRSVSYWCVLSQSIKPTPHDKRKLVFDLQFMHE